MPLTRTSFGQADDPSKENRFKPGNKMQSGRGRPTMLNDPEFAHKVAEVFITGATREEMAETFNVDTSTITRWRRDPRVKAHVGKLIEDRVLQITRKTDTEIQNRLRHIEKLSIKEILEIRKEFLPGIVREQMGGADEHTIAQATAAIEENPALAEQMIALLESKGTEVVPAGEPD
jgi:transposase-like protein